MRAILIHLRQLTLTKVSSNNSKPKGRNYSINFPVALRKIYYEYINTTNTEEEIEEIKSYEKNRVIFSGAYISVALLVVRFYYLLPLYPSRCHPIYI